MGCSGQVDAGDSETGAIQESVKNITIDPRRSLVVTEQTILSRFSFQRVMTQLAEQAGVPSVTAAAALSAMVGHAEPQPGYVRRTALRRHRRRATARPC